MTQEDKELLLRDLCVRLPFSMKLFVPSWDEREMEYVDRVDILYSVNGDGYIRTVSEDYNFSPEEVKPYLFPLSSMTEEQKKEFIKVAGYETRVEDCGRHQETYYYDSVGHENELYPNSDAIDWLNKNHFDYRGLIPKGLALDATGLNIYKIK